MGQAGAGFSKTIQDTGQHSVCIQKRAEKGEPLDIRSCRRTVKQKVSGPSAKKEKKEGAETA